MLKRNENSFATVLSFVLLSFFLIPTYSQVPRDVEMDTIYGTIDDCLGLMEVRKDSSKLYKSKRILWERCVDSDHAVLKRVTTYFYNGKHQSISYYDESKNNYKEEIVTALGRKRSIMIKMNGVEIYKRETNQRTKKSTL